jgi:hypothetical protein
LACRCFLTTTFRTSAAISANKVGLALILANRLKTLLYSTASSFSEMGVWTCARVLIRCSYPGYHSSRHSLSQRHPLSINMEVYRTDVFDFFL